MSQTFKTYSKMCVVGLIGTALQLICYTLLRQLGFYPFFANLIAVSVAICNNFLLNNKITFTQMTTGTLKTHQRFMRFVLFSALTASIQSVLVHFLTLPVHGNLGKENLVVFLIIVASSIVNFYGYRRFVWPNV